MSAEHSPKNPKESSFIPTFNNEYPINRRELIRKGSTIVGSIAGLNATVGIYELTKDGSSDRPRTIINTLISLPTAAVSAGIFLRSRGKKLSEEKL